MLNDEHGRQRSFSMPDRRKPTRCNDVGTLQLGHDSTSNGSRLTGQSAILPVRVYSLIPDGA